MHTVFKPYYQDPFLAADFTPIVEKTFKFEGGFQRHKEDTANWVKGKLIGTNRGISAKAYYNYYKRVPTVAQMKALTQKQAVKIYKSKYWDKINGDKIKNQSVAQLMFQYIIGSGSSQISNIKEIVNTILRKKALAINDRPITDAEAKIINSANQQKLWAALKAWRHAFYKRLVKKNPAKYGKFLKGWQRRLNSYSYKPTSGVSVSGKKKYLIPLGVIAGGLAAGVLVNRKPKRIAA